MAKTLSYTGLTVVVWPGLYFLNTAITTRLAMDKNASLLPGISLIGDEIKKATAPLVHKLDELKSAGGGLPDPVVHLEPENALIWSTRPGQTLGVFDLTLFNSGLGDIDAVRIQQDYFVAERGEDLIIKNLSGLSVVIQAVPLKSKDRTSVKLDFRPYSNLAKELMTNFKGPSLFGVKVTVRFRRMVDGKDFTFTRGYGSLNPLAPAIYGPDTDLDKSMRTNKTNSVLIVSDGTNYFTDSLNPGEPVAMPPHGKLRLSEVELYFGLPGHWVPVTHEIGVDKNGNRIDKYY